MKILCVCFGNTCRSPMLAALLERELGQRGITAVVESAGMADKEPRPASEHAITCMQEQGLDITAHRSRPARSLDLGTYDHFFCVETTLIQGLVDLGAPVEKIWIVNQRGGGVFNPYGGDLATYRGCAQLLERIIPELVNNL